MRIFKPVLSGKGLLAASITLLSTQVLAESAGRVSFVTGDVTASSADGSTRKLSKGDTINGGDKISTNAGRLQIRFTDGGFVSLQPNTVFGIDQYLYANKAPEETSLFFSLLQGGMRTITGAIGKVNKQSYKVRTPVATIGIRGTGYLASLSERGLIVSVGSGFVSVGNDNGQITGGAGQNIRVRDSSSAPGLSTESPDLQATDVTGERQRLAEEQSQDSDLGKTAAIGNVQSSNGSYLFLFTTETNDPPLPNSNPQTGNPKYFIDSPNLIENRRATELSATFDQDGSASGAKGALLTTTAGTSSSGNFDTGTLQTEEVGTKNDISWGLKKMGNTLTNELFDTCGDGCGGELTLSGNQYIPYIIGRPSTTNLARGKATYVLQGGTKPRDKDGNSGTLDSFKITVNLDMATIDLAMKVTMPAAPAGNAAGASAVAVGTANTYTVTTKNSQPVGIINLATANNFSLSEQYLDVSSTSGTCNNGYCSARISGFFAGDGAAQIGTAYTINDGYIGNHVSGVAALGLQSYDSNTNLESGNGYSVVYAGNSTVEVVGGYSGIDAPSGSYYDDSLNITFDANDGLASATRSGGAVTAFQRNNAIIQEVGKYGPLKWGRWYAPTATSVTVNGNETMMAAGDYLHYMTGAMTQPAIFAGIPYVYGQGATAVYTYKGGTTATASDGSTGTVTSGSKLTVRFGSAPTLALDMGLTMSAGASYKLTGNNIGINVSNGGVNFAAGSGSISCSAGGSAGGCMATVKGTFFGQQAEAIGMGYDITDYMTQGRKVKGVAGFGRGTITPPTSTQPPSTGI